MRRPGQGIVPLRVAEAGQGPEFGAVEGAVGGRARESSRARCEAAVEGSTEVASVCREAGSSASCNQLHLDGFGDCVGCSVEGGSRSKGAAKSGNATIWQVMWVSVGTAFQAQALLANLRLRRLRALRGTGSTREPGAFFVIGSSQWASRGVRGEVVRSSPVRGCTLSTFFFSRPSLSSIPP